MNSLNKKSIAGKSEGLYTEGIKSIADFPGRQE
jgi:hypothetical protein